MEHQVVSALTLGGSEDDRTVALVRDGDLLLGIGAADGFARGVHALRLRPPSDEAAGLHLRGEEVVEARAVSEDAAAPAGDVGGVAVDGGARLVEPVDGEPLEGAAAVAGPGQVAPAGAADARSFAQQAERGGL